MKKLLAVFLTIVMLISVVSAFPFSASAATQNEAEDNDSFSKANLISLGNSMNGETQESWDFDYYKFISNEDGKINITFNNTNPTSSAMHGCWSLFLYGPDEKEIAMVTLDLVETKTIVLPFIGAKAGNYYYMLVYPGPRFTGFHSYTIKTSFTKSKYYEKESNNSEANAGKLILANNYVGCIGGDSLDGDSNAVYDSDYYHIKAPANGTMTLSFKHKKRAGQYSHSGWNLNFYKHHNGGNLTLSSGNALLDSNAEQKVYSSTAVKKGDEFWLAVKSTQDASLVGGYAYSPSDIIGEPYTIASTFVLAAKPKLKAKTTKNSITLTSNKLSDVTGFEIQIKDGKKFKKLATVNKKTLKYSKKGLKKNKSYTFRVRAYLKSDGTKYYGKWVTITAKTKKK